MKIFIRKAFTTAAVFLPLISIATAVAADPGDSGRDDDRGRIELVMVRLPETWQGTTKEMDATDARENQNVVAPMDLQIQEPSFDQTLLRLNTGAGIDPLESYRFGKSETKITIADFKNAPPAPSTRRMSKSELIGFVLTRVGKVLPPFRGAAGAYNKFYVMTHTQAFKVDFDLNPLRDRYRMGITIRLP